MNDNRLYRLFKYSSTSKNKVSLWSSTTEGLLNGRNSLPHLFGHMESLANQEIVHVVSAVCLLATILVLTVYIGFYAYIYLRIDDNQCRVTDIPDTVSQAPSNTTSIDSDAQTSKSCSSDTLSSWAETEVETSS